MFVYIASLLILFTLLPSAAAAAAAVTLQEAYKSALEYESIEIRDIQLRQFDERVNQAKSGILPRVQARGSYLTQQDDAIFQAPTVDRSRTSFQIEVVQPIFQGFKEFAAIRYAEGQRLAQLAELEKSKIEIFSNLYEIFFSIKSLEQDIENLEELYRLSNERVGFLERRVSIGRSRQSELISARAQMLTVRSQLSGANTSLISFRQRFHTLTGLDFDSPITLEQISRARLEPVDTYLNKALSSPWISPERLRFEVSDENVKIARADYFPSLDVRANYYPYREGSLEDVNWDVTFNVNIPLYSGGATQSRVREAVLNKREAELEFRLKRKEIREAVRVAYHTLESGRNQLSEFELAVRLNRENYELQQKEYGLGLVSNLDVLQALNQYIESRKSLSQLKLENSQYYYELMALTGEIF